MIRLDNISKQHGHQILFIDASMGLQKGEKAGLVEPNGAGKTTLFRMIAGQERPDDGQVTIEWAKSIGNGGRMSGTMSLGTMSPGTMRQPATQAPPTQSSTPMTSSGLRNPNAGSNSSSVFRALDRPVRG